MAKFIYSESSHRFVPISENVEEIEHAQKFLEELERDFESFRVERAAEGVQVPPLSEAALYKMQRGASSWEATRPPEQKEDSLRRRLRRYQSEEGSAPTYGCHCDENKTYQQMLDNPAWFGSPEERTPLGRKADCICKFLDQYAKMAAGGISDEDLDKLYRDTQDKLVTGLKATAARTAALAEVMRPRPDDFEDVFEDLSDHWVLEHIEDPEIKNFETIIGLLRKRANSRLDKVEIIDAFVQLAHKGGPFLPNVCDAEVNGQVQLGDFFNGIVEEILDCLFEEPGPEIVLGRMRANKMAGAGRPSPMPLPAILWY